MKNEECRGISAISAGQLNAFVVTFETGDKKNSQSNADCPERPHVAVVTCY